MTSFASFRARARGLRYAGLLSTELLWVGILGVAHAAGFPSATPQPRAVMHGSRLWPRIALTFDADLTPYMATELHSGVVASFDDARIRHYLEQQHLAATFFLTGMWSEQYPAAARELASSPLFELGNHSYSHPGFVWPCYTLAKLPVGGARAKILKAQSAILKATGKTPRYFRFPGLCHNAALLETVARLGLTSVDGDVLGEDGFEPSAAVTEKNVLSQVKNGSIIVLLYHRAALSRWPQCARHLYSARADCARVALEGVYFRHPLRTAQIAPRDPLKVGP